MLTEYMQSIGSKALKAGWVSRNNTSDVEEAPPERRNPALRRQIVIKRQSLRQELGIELPDTHFARPQERPFTRCQRAHTTIMFGGLTWKHERLIKAFAEPMGYRFEPLPVPDVDAFQTGKEYGNNGQCNPTYFTVGNLISYLQRLEASGIKRQDIIDNYLFFTAGACGPCRFGMYEAEYRLALQNAGYDGFRIILFQQKNGIFQGDDDQGLNLDVRFFLNLLNSLVIGDLLNEVAYRIRPYERVEGETDKVLERSISRIASLMQQFNNELNVQARGKNLSIWVQLLLGDRFVNQLKQIACDFDAIDVDYLQPKPIVKITGEFWAQTTEGDGNYHMFSFLEKENAEVLVEPIGTWITYLLHQALQRLRDQKAVEPSFTRRLSLQKKIGMLKLGEKIFIRLWNRYRRAFNNIPHPLVDQYHLKDIAGKYYNTRAQGGEGHLEVAKNIYYSSNDLAHMVLSLKPFGCMPSTQSDGVQSAIVNLYPEMIFLPLETSGESEVNAHSRVQMALGEARNKARNEFNRILEEAGVDLEQVRAFIDKHPRWKTALQGFDSQHSACGTGARFLLKLVSEMKKGSEYA